MGSTQSTAMVNSLLNQESVIDYECFDGYLDTQDPLLGAQKYIILKPGCKGKIEASEDFDGGVVIFISVEKDTYPVSQSLRLALDGQSLDGVPVDKIFIPMIVNGVPFIPSLAHLNRVYNRQLGVPMNGNVRNTFSNAVLGNNGVPMQNANMVVGQRRRVGNRSCSCNK